LSRLINELTNKPAPVTAYMTRSRIRRFRGRACRRRSRPGCCSLPLCLGLDLSLDLFLDLLLLQGLDLLEGCLRSGKNFGFEFFNGYHSLPKCSRKIEQLLETKLYTRFGSLYVLHTFGPSPSASRHIFECNQYASTL